LQLVENNKSSTGLVIENLSDQTINQLEPTNQPINHVKLFRS